MEVQPNDADLNQTSATPASGSSESPEVEIIDLTALSESSEDVDEVSASEESEEEIVIDEDQYTEARALLEQVIFTVPEQRLRQAMSNILQRVPAAHMEALQELIAFEPDGQPIPRWEICAQCSDEMDMSAGGKNDECVFHPGYLKPENAVMEGQEDKLSSDPVEQVHAIQDSSVWTCCKSHAAAASPGCVRSQHKAGGTQKKRRL